MQVTGSKIKKRESFQSRMPGIMSRKPESIAFSQVQVILILVLLTVHGVFLFIGMQLVPTGMITPSSGIPLLRE